MTQGQRRQPVFKTTLSGEWLLRPIPPVARRASLPPGWPSNIASESPEIVMIEGERELVYHPSSPSSHPTLHSTTNAISIKIGTPGHRFP